VHLCSVMVRMMEDKVNGLDNHCGQVGEVYISLSSNGQKEGSTAALVKLALERTERAQLI